MFAVEVIVNFEMEAGRNPTFIFDTLKKASIFMKLCLVNGYGASVQEVE